MKLPEIEQFIKDFEFPDEIKLNKASTIRDVAKFFDSHICAMEYDGNPRTVKMLHYDRVMKAISIMKEHGLVARTGTCIEPVVKEKNDNALDMPESFHTEDAIKPNDDFDNASKPIKPNTSFDDEKPVEREIIIPEPQRIVEKEVPKKKEPPQSNQGSLF